MIFLRLDRVRVHHSTAASRRGCGGETALDPRRVRGFMMPNAQANSALIRVITYVKSLVSLPERYPPFTNETVLLNPHTGERNAQSAFHQLHSQIRHCLL